MKEQNLEKKPEIPQGSSRGSESSRTKATMLRALSVVGAAAVVFGAGYLIFRYLPGTWFSQSRNGGGDILIDSPIDDVADVVKNENVDSRILYLETASTFSKYKETADENRDFTPSLDDKKIEVRWYSGARVASAEMKEVLAEMTKDLDKGEDLASGEDEPLYGEFFLFESGVITAPEELAGRTLYLISEGLGGLGVYYGGEFAIYDDELSEFIYVTDGEYNCSSSQLCKSFVLQEFPELVAPDTLDIPGQKSILAKVGYLIKKQEEDNTIFTFGDKGTPYNRGGLVNVEKGQVEPLPNIGNIFFTDPKYGPVYFVNKQFRIVLPDGSVYKYDLVPYFFATEELKAQKQMYDIRSKVDIVWNEGYKGEGTYTPSGGLVQGCATTIGGFPNIFNDIEWFLKEQMIEVGKTQTGESVFALKEPRVNTYYKDVFDFGYEGAAVMEYSGVWDEEKRKEFENIREEEKFDDFIEDDPIFFWKDPWGNWRGFRKAKYQTLAECGKPVIYLYPNEDADIHVQVEPEGGFKTTDPDYGKDGWFVRASKDGKILNYTDGKEYEYLFWEGYEYNYEVPCYGFVMSRENVDAKMYNILEKLGMNKKESADFMEFWQEKLTQKPYVFVTFLPQNEFDKIAPLEVNPAPDTVIRVFMDYQPLDQPITMREPFIMTPERKGFTVVEWGGRLK